MTRHAQQQKSQAPAPLRFFPVHIPNLSDQNSLGERGNVHCVCACMHACIHAAAIILPGAELDPETRTFHGEDTEQGGFKQLKGLQCKSQGNTFKFAFPPINSHSAPPQMPPLPIKVFLFSLQITPCTRSH